MEQQIADLIGCVQALTREVAELKQAEADRRRREVEASEVRKQEAREAEARKKQQAREEEEAREEEMGSLEEEVEEFSKKGRKNRKRDRTQEEKR